MTDKQIIIAGVDVSWCKYFCLNQIGNNCLNHNQGFSMNCNNNNCYYKQLKQKEKECEELKQYKSLFEKTRNLWNESRMNNYKLLDEIKDLKDSLKRTICQSECYKHKEADKLRQTLAEIKELANPYKMTIKKICGNCKKYNDCHACCYKDINCYKYTSSETNACEEFVYLDEFVPNLLANNVLQKISECEVEDGFRY